LGTQKRKGLRGLESYSYLKLNNKLILARFSTFQSN
jgi:hypothetical protein